VICLSSAHFTRTIEQLILGVVFVAVIAVVVVIVVYRRSDVSIT
jgi:hypothetical protein